MDLVRAADGVLVGAASPAMVGQGTTGGALRTLALTVRTQAAHWRLLNAPRVLQVTREPCGGGDRVRSRLGCPEVTRSHVNPAKCGGGAGTGHGWAAQRSPDHT